jgi:4-amino-4-deoxy-L-arabinose transferase-like glycosyltransferase
LSIHLRPIATACLLALATFILYSLELRREPVGPEEARVLSAAQQVPNGVPPLLVNTGGDRWLQPIGVYATTISHAIAPGFFAGRRASIAVASLNVALIFLVAWRLFSRYLPALVAAILLMFTPAHIAFGRIGIDAIYVIPFILLWLYALLDFLDRDRPAAIGLAAAALGAGVYSTPSAPLTMVLLWITMMVALWVAGRRKASTLAIAAGTFVAALVPLMIWFYLQPHTYLDTYGRWAIFAAHLRNPVDGFRAFINTNTLGTRASAYWGLIDPSYLFFSSARSTAPLLLVSAPLIVAGVVRCVRLASSQTAAVVVLAGLLVAPLAGSSFGERNYIALALGLLPFAALLAAYGIEEIRELIVGRPQPAPEESGA